MELKISFISNFAKDLYRSAGFQDSVSSGFDLVNVMPLTFKPGEFQLINLGIRIKPPEGYHSLVLPRSSTYKRYGLLMANSIGLVDENYCGEKDIWHMPALYLPKKLEKLEIPTGTRLCQFILQPKYRFNIVEYTPEAASRGGIGSTGA